MINNYPDKHNDYFRLEGNIKINVDTQEHNSDV